MKKTLAFFPVIFLINFLVTPVLSPPVMAEIPQQLLEEDHCISCHQELEILPDDFQDYDVHLQPRLSCAGCHGGDPTSEDPEVAMSPKKGFVGVPSRKTTPQFCGKCHSHIEFMRKYQPRIATDQVQQYYTSVHGEKLQKGDEKVAECVSCHSAHKIASATDGRSTVYALNVPATCNKCHGDGEYMKGYNIPTNQYDKYVVSVHGIDLLEKKDVSAPACNDCHGNHGATPPGIQSVAHVCGNCHVNNMQYFEASPMAEPFGEMEIHGCEQSDEMISVGEASVCTTCHSQGDSGYVAARNIYSNISSFVTLYDSAQSKLKDVQKKGMDDVDIMYLLKDAHQTLIHTRTLVHTFDPAQVREKTSEGEKKSDEAITLANKEIKDYYIRRRGFGMATIFITILVIALFFKIKRLDR
ncbi:MAG: cytochrome c3 family protein [Calditrichota bacterium]